MQPYRRLSLIICLLISYKAFANEQGLFDFDLSEPQKNKQKWQTDAYIEFRPRYLTEQKESLSSRLSGSLNLKLSNNNWRSFISLSSEYDNVKSGYRSPLRNNIDEAYLSYDGPETDITIGKQRVNWGATDGISTIARVNAIDFRDPIKNGRTASRRSSWLLRLQHTNGFGDFEAVWLPRGRDRKLAEPGSPWETPALNHLRQLQQDGSVELSIEDPHHHEFGLRYQRYGQGLDWGMAVYDGYSDAPTVVTGSDSSVTLSPERIRIWNLNAVYAFPKSTLRGEIAYTDQVSVNGLTGKRRQAIFGWDTTLLTDLYINAQVFWNSYTALEDEYGATVALTKPLLGGAIETGLSGQFARQQQKATEIFIDYSLNDNLTLSGRYFKFSGSAGTPLGTFRENDFLELSLRWDIF